jgi:hypothetical protein
MGRHLIERWTDTTTFGVALAFAGALALPLLGLGVIVSVGLIVGALVEQTANPLGTVIVALSAGGAIGVIGWVRALRGINRPEEHNVTLTLVYLVIGTVTALAVGAISSVPMVVSLREPWELPTDAWPVVLFVAAHMVWVLAGIGWMQRLTRRYAEHTGRAFDGIPAALLCVAIALAAAAALVTMLS